MLLFFRFYGFTQFTIQLNDPEYGMYLCTLQANQKLIQPICVCPACVAYVHVLKICLVKFVMTSSFRYFCCFYIL